MPRKSAASLAVVPLAPKERPSPPDRLGPEEAILWRECTASKAPDFFDSASRPILEQYCIMVCLARGLAADLAALRRQDVVARVKMLAAYDTATKAAVSHARALRITHQSRVSKSATTQLSIPTGPGRKIWECE